MREKNNEFFISKKKIVTVYSHIILIKNKVNQFKKKLI